MQGKFFIGEVSLSGEVRSVNGVLPMTILARSLGVEELYVPADNAAEAATIQDVRVFGVHNIGELIDHLEGDAPLSPAQPADFTEPDAPENLLDFSDVKGQQTVKRALEIVAARRTQCSVGWSTRQRKKYACETDAVHPAGNDYGRIH